MKISVQISVQVESSNLLSLYQVIELQFKNDFGGVCMFGQGIYGCENRKGKGGVASPMDLISKFVTCL